MKFVPNAITRSLGRASLQGQQNAPTILFGVGVVGMIGSTVLACRATLKLEEILETHQTDMKVAKDMLLDRPDIYNEQEQRKDIALIHTRSVLALGKLYGPSILVGATSIGCLTKSHNLLNERVAAVTAAYAAIDSAFERYRQRVTEKYGYEEDRQLRYGAEEVDVVDEDTGKLTKAFRASDESPSGYARHFDQFSANWSKDPEYNLLFLRNQQNWFNDLLKVRGHVFLNEVYDALDLSHTRAGSVVGWVVGTDGDNFIDFGIWDTRNDRAIDFVNGREASILLDFNVDGIIFDKLGDGQDVAPWQS